LPKLKEILVDLSVRNTPKVIRELRLVGPAMQFTEFGNKKRFIDLTPEECEEYLTPAQQERYANLDSLDRNDPIRQEAWRKSVEIPFPDKDLNSNFTRIGHDDPEQCPWRKLKYISSKKYAQKCFEKVNNEWVPKVICKGSSIFEAFGLWEARRYAENLDDETITWFLGGDKAPIVEITAVHDTSKLGDVDYSVFIKSKDVDLTETMINELRGVREPSPDDLNRIRKEYIEEQESDESMPEWRDYFEYGHDIRRIFQHTPPKSNSVSANTQEKSKSVEDDQVDPLVNDLAETSSEEAEGLEDINW
jgi:hypothetical protein